MEPKPLNLETITDLLSGKRKTVTKRPRRRPDPPSEFSLEKERPEWHKWVYGGQRKPQ